MLPKIIPIDLVFRGRSEQGGKNKTPRREAKKITIKRWQREWERSEKEM